MLLYFGNKGLVECELKNSVHHNYYVIDEMGGAEFLTKYLFTTSLYIGSSYFLQQNHEYLV